MIEINLLPDQYRKKEPAFKKIGLAELDLTKIPVLKIAIAFIAALILLHAVLFYIGASSESTLSKMSKDYDKVLSLKSQADSLKSQIAIMDEKTKAVDDLVTKGVNWAGKLNALSDSVTPGIWLSELSYEQRMTDKPLTKDSARETGARANRPASVPAEPYFLDYLVITGYASSMGEQGTALVGKFMNSLKDNADFYSDFQAIELVSIKSGRFDNKEVMSFKVACLFKEKR